MEDTLLKKKCGHCDGNLILMESCRSDDPHTVYLVEKCFYCGRHPHKEVARLADEQEGLNQ